MGPDWMAREAEIRRHHEDRRQGPCEGCDLLAALDAERATHEQTRRERDAARAGETRAVIDRDHAISAQACESLSVDKAKRERDEARATLLSLRRVLERAEWYIDPRHGSPGHPAYEAERSAMLGEIRAALAAVPATLADQMRARVRAEVRAETLRWAHGMVCMRVSGGTAEIAINFLDIMTKMAAEKAGLSIKEIDALAASAATEEAQDADEEDGA